MTSNTVAVSVASLFTTPATHDRDRMSSNKTVNLEKSLASLEKLVDELESGDLPLEKAMQKFEEGIKLTRSCQAALREAEQKVEILMQDADGDAVEEFLEDD